MLWVSLLCFRFRQKGDHRGRLYKCCASPFDSLPCVFLFVWLFVCFDKEEKGEGDNSILPTKKMYVSYIQTDIIVNYIFLLPVYDGQFAYQPVKSECFFAHWMVFAMCLKWSIF